MVYARTALRAGALIGALIAPVSMEPRTLEADPRSRVDLEQGTRVVVDLSERVLRVYNGGELMSTFRVAIGQPAHPTPRGSFRIDRIIWNPGWVPPDAEWAKDEPRRAPDDPENPMVGAKLFFKYPDYYIHGTNAPGSLGEAASHGCIRMNGVDVINLAEFLQARGGMPKSEAWFREVARNDATSHAVRLPRPIEMVIRD